MNSGPEMRNESEMADAVEFAELEAELAAALRPIELPAGFTARGLAAASAASGPKRAKVLPWRVLGAFGRWRTAVSGAVAASLVAGLLGAEAVHQRHERERAAAAAQQLETAMRVTNRALDQTRAQLARAGFRL